MLEHVEIKNYALIKSLCIDIPSGFVCISGETGAGKSIMLEALSLVLGGKAKADAIRHGEKEASVLAVFSYKSGDAVDAFLRDKELFDEDSPNEVVMQRTVRQSGRSIASVNGIVVRGDVLSSLSSLLADFSAQHGSHNLMRKDVQLSLLDAYSKDGGTLAEYKASYSKLKAAEEELKELKEKEERRKGDLDYILYCLNELEKASLKEGEDDELAEEIRRMESSEQLTEAVTDAQAELRGELGGGALSSLKSAESLLRKASLKDPSLGEYARRLESAAIEAEDISESLRDYISSLVFSPDELEAKESRLSELQRIKKKYGPTIGDAIKKRDSLQKEKEASESFPDDLLEIERSVDALRKETASLSSSLTEKRRKGASKLSLDIEKRLRKLGMKDAEFRIELSPAPLSATGADSASFLVLPNKGEKIGEINEIASGGELSRIMLSIKCAISTLDGVGTLIFDEIDSGIGGSVANDVSEELVSLSKSCQVICITHLAQIASKADRHFVISKHDEDGRTLSEISEVVGVGREKEIARLLSGETSDVAMEHAKVMLRS